MILHIAVAKVQIVLSLVAILIIGDDRETFLLLFLLCINPGCSMI